MGTGITGAQLTCDRLDQLNQPGTHPPWEWDGAQPSTPQNLRRTPGERQTSRVGNRTSFAPADPEPDQKLPVVLLVLPSWFRSAGQETRGGRRARSWTTSVSSSSLDLDLRTSGHMTSAAAGSWFSPSLSSSGWINGPPPGGSTTHRTRCRA